MRFAIEFSTEAEGDFDLIFDHLFESYVAFGEGPEEALDHAGRRVMAIRKAADRLSTFPLRSTARDDVLPGIRFLAVARAVYWFDVDQAARKVRILAVFFGGQDHIRHMLVRLLGKNEAR
ncbi:MAG: type II toxin-antitoxin system RelE/ParE family toxin [Rhodospirillales bacterium]|nr:type II toxin-antitoxin system RelE/ParE family toxin [Rhodospirillales bacterium]